MSYKLILSNGDVVVLDKQDYKTYSGYRWYNHDGYAARRDQSANKIVFLHRLINNTPDKLVTDHINGNRLDNRRSNLRSCTRRQNSYNSGSSRRTPKYPYVGITKLPYGKWRARISPDKTTIHLGVFNTAKDAAKAYNLAAKKCYGEFARLNKGV